MTATATRLEHPIGVDGLFVLRIRAGAARLHGVDGETVRVRTDADLDDSFRVERGAGSLSIQPTRTFDLLIGRGRSHGPEFDVELPHRATVVVEVTSADLRVEALRGDQRYRTVSGDVTLHSVAGSIQVDAVSGDVRLAADGELALGARTVSGDLEVRAGRIGAMRAATTSGDVRLAGELADGTTHRIETVSGDMTLAIAGGVRLEASSVAGDVRADVPHRSEGGRGHRTVIVGDGRSTLETSSMSGSVRLVEARPVEPDRTARPAPIAAEPPPPMEPPAPPVPEPPAPEPAAPVGDDERLTILRALEHGEIDVAEAGRRLARLDAGTAETDR